MMHKVFDSELYIQDVKDTLNRYPYKYTKRQCDQLIHKYYLIIDHLRLKCKDPQHTAREIDKKEMKRK